MVRFDEMVLGGSLPPFGLILCQRILLRLYVFFLSDGPIVLNLAVSATVSANVTQAKPRANILCSREWVILPDCNIQGFQVCPIFLRESMQIAIAI